ncbi:MAG TPA: beta-galactosidase, partial [Vicinamibacterales bacterium]|nr:beta-galactosidase [Vicinamibacterales bacterium]
MTRREWLKLTTAAGGAALLPNVTGVLGRAGASAQTAPAAGRERLLADFGWRFHLGHADDVAKDFGYGRGGAFAKSGSLIGGRGSVTQAAFDDSAWTAVDLPHDWAIDLPFSEDRNLNGHGAKPLGRAYPDTSIGWYRRTFDIPASDAGRRIAIEFDGVFRDCLVILNGHYVGRNLSGYVPFRFDITDLVTYGGRNALVVRVDATEYEGWFYEGAGIYRHVWLEKTAPLHVAPWGTFVTSAFNPDGATVTIANEIRNDSDTNPVCQVVLTIVDKDGRAVANYAGSPMPAAAWGNLMFKYQMKLQHPLLWSVDAPNMYKAITEVRAGSNVVDTYETPFGIRSVHFDADKGFFLNGEPVKIKGTCNHQDHAGVGAGLPDRLQYFRIEKLKEMGSNAYRT